jgi:hypothetical protein
LVLAMASCLDDDKAPLDPEGSSNIIEFLDPSVPSSPSGAIYPAWVSSFAVAPEATFEQVISYSGPNGNDKDIQLTLEVDPIALDQYNFQADTLGNATYDLLPENLYSIESMTVTIPKGQTKVTLPITVYPDQFDLSKTYALPLRIASASSGILSAHFSVAILVTVVKNKYDGVYTVTPYQGIPVNQAMDDVTNAAFVGIYPKEVEFRTVNGNTVNYYDVDYDVQGHIFYTGTGASYYGGFAAQFQFDDVTNTVTSVVSAFGQGNNNRLAKLDPGPGNIDRDGDGVFEDNADPLLDEVGVPAPAPVMTFEADGVTPKTLTIWYIMRQINTSTDRAFWKETYTYKGPR